MKSSNNSTEQIWPAPAKLNLFLHITGQLANGYHQLQTVFQFLSVADSLQFRSRTDGEIRRLTDNADVEEQDDLVVRAARALQQYTNTKEGAEISLQKILPMGGGLGGGSSDAATTLVALNQLWQTRLSTSQLAEIGVSLGADVPVFVQGHAAWAEGVGEQLTPVDLPEPWYVVVYPAVHVSTAALFAAPELTRDVRPITIRDYLAGRSGNVFESLVKMRYPVVAQVFEWLTRQSGRKARLTGTGSCVFVDLESESHARVIAQQVPHPWQAFCAKGLNRSPLLDVSI